MKKYYTCLLALLSFSSLVSAQTLTSVPSGGNKKASVSEQVGLTQVTIHYDRPAVKGREGKIWNGLVHNGFADLGFGTSKQAPWRAGANENTTISFSTDVKIEGKDLAAGTYGFFVAMDEGTATLIFSKNSTSWGSFFYDPKEDALRVTVKTQPLQQSVEWLKYEFTNQTDNSATIALQWEKLSIPFTVETDLVKTQMAIYREELKSNKGFNTDAWVQAAQYAANHNYLDEAAAWADYAINGVFVGQKNFKTVSTKAMILEKQGKSSEADAVMKEAMPMATMQELHQYGRQLIAAKKPKEAMEAFKLNAQKNPAVFTTNVGLARGYAANADYKNALKYLRAALPQAPDKANKDAIERMIPMLEQGKDIN